MMFENLAIDRVIIHEIFKRTEGREMVTPAYGTSLVNLDTEALNALCDRINSAMGSATRSMELDIAQSEPGSCICMVCPAI